MSKLTTCKSSEFSCKIRSCLKMTPAFDSITAKSLKYLCGSSRESHVWNSSKMKVKLKLKSSRMSPTLQSSKFYRLNLIKLNRRSNTLKLLRIVWMLFPFIRINWFWTCKNKQTLRKNSFSIKSILSASMCSRLNTLCQILLRFLSS